MKPTTLATLLITTLISLTAHAAHIKMSFSVLFTGNNPELSIVEMVFDTSIPPEPGANNALLFYPISTTLTTSPGPNGSPLCSESTVFVIARLQYLSTGNTISMEVSDGIDQGSLSISNMPAAFNPAMNSLPDDPNDWAFNTATSVFNGRTTDIGFVFWHPASGFVGGEITYCIKDVPPPSNACSPADINQDGELDFFDISAFLTVFGLGCP